MKFQGLANNVNAIDPQEVKEALAEGADSAFGSITRSCLCYPNSYSACITQTPTLLVLPKPILFVPQILFSLGPISLLLKNAAPFQKFTLRFWRE